MARHSDLYRLIQPVPDLRSEDGRARMADAVVAGIEAALAARG